MTYRRRRAGDQSNNPRKPLSRNVYYSWSPFSEGALMHNRGPTYRQEIPYRERKLELLKLADDVKPFGIGKSYDRYRMTWTESHGFCYNTSPHERIEEGIPQEILEKFRQDIVNEVKGRPDSEFSTYVRAHAQEMGINSLQNCTHRIDVKELLREITAEPPKTDPLSEEGLAATRREVSAAAILAQERADYARTQNAGIELFGKILDSDSAAKLFGNCSLAPQEMPIGIGKTYYDNDAVTYRVYWTKKEGGFQVICFEKDEISEDERNVMVERFKDDIIIVLTNGNRNSRVYEFIDSNAAAIGIEDDESA